MTTMPDRITVGSTPTSTCTSLRRWITSAAARRGVLPATAAGHRQLRDWLGAFGTVILVGVEGTGSYGAGHPPPPRDRC
jgi:transposase